MEAECRVLRSLLSQWFPPQTLFWPANDGLLRNTNALSSGAFTFGVVLVEEGTEWPVAPGVAHGSFHHIFLAASVQNIVSCNSPNQHNSHTVCLATCEYAFLKVTFHLQMCAGQGSTLWFGLFFQPKRVNCTDIKLYVGLYEARGTPP